MSTIITRLNSLPNSEVSNRTASALVQESQERRKLRHLQLRDGKLIEDFLLHIGPFRPMNLRPDVLFLVVPLVAEEKIVDSAGVAYGICVLVFWLCSVVFVVVFHMGQEPSEIERQQIEEYQILA